jgi:hypothetical protein
LHQNFLIKKYFLGFTSAIFLGLSVLSGCFALFSKNFKLTKPIFLKIFHNIFALCAFGFGMVAIIIAYNTRPFVRYVDPGNIRYWMLGFLSTIFAITLIAPMKASVRHFKTFTN